jgi:hypothetical protein
MRALAAVALVALLWGSAEAGGTSYFRVTYVIDRSGPREIRLVGRIANEASLDAIGVRLRVEALDPAGNVLAEPPAFVDRVVRARSEGYWEASVPPDPRITGFRVTVVGYRYQVQGP